MLWVAALVAVRTHSSCTDTQPESTVRARVVRCRNKPASSHLAQDVLTPFVGTYLLVLLLMVHSC